MPEVSERAGAVCHAALGVQTAGLQRGEAQTAGITACVFGVKRMESAMGSEGNAEGPGGGAPWRHEGVSVWVWV